MGIRDSQELCSQPNLLIAMHQDSWLSTADQLAIPSSQETKGCSALLVPNPGLQQPNGWPSRIPNPESRISTPASNLRGRGQRIAQAINGDDLEFANAQFLRRIGLRHDGMTEPVRGGLAQALLAIWHWPDFA
jgi:hypothetical protein